MTIKNSQGTVRRLSKVLTLGKDYRMFARVTATPNGECDILAASVPGREADYDKLKASFVRIDDFDVTESNKIIDNSGLIPIARIARVFFEAEYAAAIEDAKELAEKDRKARGKATIDEIALAAAIKKIDVEYHGDNEANPKVYPTKKPLIGSVVTPIATEVLIIPLKDDETPDFANMVSASLDISGKRYANITSIINNKNYCNPESGYVEIGFSWKGKDNKEAGTNINFQGISKDLALATMYPDAWNANVETILSRLPKTAENIAARNSTMSSRTTPKEITETIKKYMLGHPLILTHINCEDDSVKSIAKEILDFGVVDDIPSVQGQLLALLEAGETSQEVAPEASDMLEGVQLDALKNAETVGQIASAVGGDIDAVVGVGDIDNL